MERKVALLSALVIGIPLSSAAPPPPRTILLSKPFRYRRWTTISFHYCIFSLSLSLLVINRDGCCSCTQFSPPLLRLMTSRSAALLSLYCTLFRCKVCHTVGYGHCRRFIENVNVFWRGVTIVHPRASSIAGYSPLENFVYCKTLFNERSLSNPVSGCCPFQEVCLCGTFYFAGHCPVQEVVHWRTLSSARRRTLAIAGCCPLPDVVHFRILSTAGSCALQGTVHCRTLSTSRLCPFQGTFHCRMLYTSR